MSNTLKTYVKAKLKNLLVKLSAQERFQRMLERNLSLTLYLMGIGCESAPEASGENILMTILRKNSDNRTKSLCVFDVGANQGQFLNLVLIGLKGIPLTVHAFEPGRFSFEVLYEKYSGLTNVQLNHFGLGKHAGIFNLFYNAPGSGLASLSQRTLNHYQIDFTSFEEVQIELLDRYCERCDIQSIDLLKLDVEGHELDVLEGSERMLRERRIKMVSFEFGGCNIDSRTYFQDYWYFLKKIGMDAIYRITPSGYLLPIQQYDERCEQFLLSTYLARWATV